MRIRGSLATLVFVLLTFSTLWSQQQIVELRINLVYAFTDAPSGNGQPSAEPRNNSGNGEQARGSANYQIRVQVLNSDGSTVSEQTPNAEGQVRVRVVGSLNVGGRKTFATYRVRVFGPEIQEVLLEDIQPGIGDAMLNVQIRRKPSKDHVEMSGDPMVSAATLNIPPKAQKELDKANDLLGKKDYARAAEHFQKAVEIYPKFDHAWNNLGVVKMKMGDAEGGKVAFEKALEANDKFARAYVNLARIDMANQDYAKASERLTKSLSIEPLNAEALSMSCQSALLEGKTTEVVNASVKLHSVPHEGLALCHYAAGLAYAKMNKRDDAIKEYRLFLAESPDNPLVAKAREAIQQFDQAVPEQK